MAKPSGAACNLACDYCFFLDKALLYPGSKLRMGRNTLREYVRSYVSAQPGPNVHMYWQGGEPTLMGVEFFQDAFELAAQEAGEGRTVSHSFQTNGVLLNDKWIDLFSRWDVLVGVSIDGPAHLHDVFRRNRASRGTHEQVVRGWRLLEQGGVRRNVLATVNSANQDHGLEVYRHLRDDLGATHIQFIPVVERTQDVGTTLAPWSVGPEGYGNFLIEVFDEWKTGDAGRISVQLFDVTAEALYGQYSLCVHAPRCGDILAIEHNGDVYSCDHFVDVEHRLGNLHETDLSSLALGQKQRQFGAQKYEGLAKQCLECPVRRLCNGGCPKDRWCINEDGEPINYLCDGFRAFFTHAVPDLVSLTSFQIGAP